MNYLWDKYTVKQAYARVVSATCQSYQDLPGSTEFGRDAKQVISRLGTNNQPFYTMSTKFGYGQWLYDDIEVKNTSFSKNNPLKDLRIGSKTDYLHTDNITLQEIFQQSKDGIVYFFYNSASYLVSELQVYQTTSGFRYVWRYIDTALVDTRDVLVTSNIVATSGTYPTNGKHTDGYWYVRKGEANSAPIINVTSPTEARTLYENDTLSIVGNVNDTNVGDVVSVKYSIDGGTAQAISAIVSTGIAASFAKNLTYKSGKLYDGSTAITNTLAEGSQHTLQTWSEDDKGGKSPIISRVFYVVPNRAATLSLDAFITRTGLINTDVVNVSGTVADLDNDNVIVKYKIGNGAFVQVYNGQATSAPTPFDFNILLADLADGANQITIKAVDAYNAITQVVLNLNKEAVEQALLNAVTYYEITPSNGSADGLQLYVERELGDLVVSADVFMGANGETEVFVPMTLAGTANLTNGNVEDTFSYQHSAEASKIVVRINMTRTGTATNKAIKKISGVLT